MYTIKPPTLKVLTTLRGGSTKKEPMGMAGGTDLVGPRKPPWNAILGKKYLEEDYEGKCLRCESEDHQAKDCTVDLQVDQDHNTTASEDDEDDAALMDALGVASRGPTQSTHGLEGGGVFRDARQSAYGLKGGGEGDEDEDELHAIEPPEGFLEEEGAFVRKKRIGTRKGTGENPFRPARNSTRCIRCREKGHYAINCTLDVKCVNCQQFGHRMADCTQPIKCFACDGTGHIRSQCLEKLKKKVAKGWDKPPLFIGKDSKDIERQFGFKADELMTSNIEISEKDIKWTNKPTTESVEDEDDEDGKDVGDVNVDNEA
mmetsp:Transcript_12049/g.19141  ORF Transcript_12049/g.19141 Transcript_12049/m.19141 type:complete len:316 (-) Transcript_12049:151-1098(-)